MYLQFIFLIKWSLNYIKIIDEAIWFELRNRHDITHTIYMYKNVVL